MAHEALLLQLAAQAVHQAPLPSGWSFDPVALARAVNRLHALGRDQALATLRDYASQAERGEPAADGVARDPLRTLLVIKLLFVPASADTPLPPLALGMPDVNLPAQDPAWPHLPLVLGGDLPFLPVGGYFVAGAMLSTLSVLDAFAAQGRLRDTPLIPAPPAEAAGALVGSTAWADLGPAEQEPRLRAMVYAQALRAAGPAAAVDEPTIQSLALAAPADLDAVWQPLSAALRALNLVWDSGDQLYRPAPTAA